MKTDLCGANLLLGLVLENSLDTTVLLSCYILQ